MADKRLNSHLWQWDPRQQKFAGVPGLRVRISAPNHNFIQENWLSFRTSLPHGDYSTGNSWEPKFLGRERGGSPKARNWNCPLEMGSFIYLFLQFSLNITPLWPQCGSESPFLRIFCFFTETCWFESPTPACRRRGFQRAAELWLWHGELVAITCSASFTEPPWALLISGGEFPYWFQCLCLVFI